jgi:hypothetical protein
VLVLLGGVAVAGVLGNKHDELPPVDLSTLTASSTQTTIAAAPLDPEPYAGTDGLVVHPKAETALYTAPAAEAFAKIGPRQFGATWLPVVEKTEPVDRLDPGRESGSRRFGVPDPCAHRLADHRVVRAGQAAR